jgi:hypothetical protein
MPWECFICASWEHDCGHREPEIVAHVLGDAPRLEREAWATNKANEIMRRRRMRTADDVRSYM